MARHGRWPLAAAVAVTALSLTTTTIQLPTVTNIYPLGHLGTGTSGDAGRRNVRPHAVGTDTWTPTKDGPNGLVTTHPDGEGDGSPAAPGRTPVSPGTATPGAGPGTATPDTGPGTATPDTGPGTATPDTGPADPGATPPPTSEPGEPGQPPSAGCPPATGSVIKAAPGSGRTIALTFDDGPGPQTGAVLDVLAAHHVHATFFVAGGAVVKDPATATRTAAEGHLIANHTWDHAYPRAVPHGWTTSYLRGQLTRTSAVIAEATSLPTCFFRPPGGYLPQTVRQVTTQVRQQIVLWSVDPQDWAVQGSRNPGPAGRAREANQIFRASIEGAAQAHPILLLHDSGGYRGATVAALPRIIAYYKAQGYRFVRLDDRS